MSPIPPHDVDSSTIPEDDVDRLRREADEMIARARRIRQQSLAAVRSTRPPEPARPTLWRWRRALHLS
jgi:hypothetical protein